MKIDKTRFLLLTSSLAATATVFAVSTTACNTTTTSTETPDSSTTTPDSGTSDSGGNTSDGGAECLGATSAAPVCFVEGGGTTDAGTDDAGTDDAGTDAGTAATGAKCVTECEQAKGLFKSDIAKAISACVDSKVQDPTVEGACFTPVEGCIAETLPKACADDTATDFCTQTLQACGGGDDAGGDAGITAAQCKTYASALTDEARTRLSSCVAESGCDTCFALVTSGAL